MENLPKEIRAKMQKLLAMSESKANMHEAEIATEKLHKLLIEYNIEQSKLRGLHTNDEVSTKLYHKLYGYEGKINASLICISYDLI